MVKRLRVKLSRTEQNGTEQKMEPKERVARFALKTVAKRNHTEASMISIPVSKQK